jgi:hypothetical protein
MRISINLQDEYTKGLLTPQPGSIAGFPSSKKRPGYNSTMSGWSYNDRRMSAILGSGLMSSIVSCLLSPKESRNSLSDATCHLRAWSIPRISTTRRALGTILAPKRPAGSSMLFRISSTISASLKRPVFSSRFNPAKVRSFGSSGMLVSNFKRPVSSSLGLSSSRGLLSPLKTSRLRKSSSHFSSRCDMMGWKRYNRLNSAETWLPTPLQGVSTRLGRYGTRLHTEAFHPH